MSDTTFIAFLALLVFLFTLAFCGTPDLHDALIDRVGDYRG